MKDILKQRTPSNSLKEYALKYMEATGSFEFTIVEIKKLYTEIVRIIKEFGENKDLSGIIHYLVSRIDAPPPKEEKKHSERIELTLSAEQVN